MTEISVTSAIIVWLVGIIPMTAIYAYFDIRRCKKIGESWKKGHTEECFSFGILWPLALPYQFCARPFRAAFAALDRIGRNATHD